MNMRKAFKFELMPNGAHNRKLKQFCGCARFVFNKALDWQNSQYKTDNTFKFRYTKIANLLPQWKVDHAWLGECHSQVLQQSLKDLESSFRNFFQKRADFPKFKKKGMKESFRFPQGAKLDEANSRVYFPKIGWMRYRNSRSVCGAIKNMTVSQKSGKWFVAIQTEHTVEQPLPVGGEIGIDLGIVRFATLSDGGYFEPLHSFKKRSDQLKKAQQALSRKATFSKNWYKAKQRVSTIHHHIANTRKDYLHKISTNISKNHAMVYVEDLQVSNMSKSSKGDVMNHGKQVKQKSGLNRRILDQGWFEFRRQLDYKLAWHGGFLLTVPPKNTSRRCPACDYVSGENRKTQADFLCQQCGFTENADVVAAMNILRAGHAQLACEVNGAVMPSAAGTHRSGLVSHH
jgi:putative transposase